MATMQPTKRSTSHKGPDHYAALRTAAQEASPEFWTVSSIEAGNALVHSQHAEHKPANDFGLDDGMQALVMIKGTREALLGLDGSDCSPVLPQAVRRVSRQRTLGM